MKTSTPLICLALLTVGSASFLSAAPSKKLLPIPDKLVVLTFDDGNVSDLTTVAPILKDHGFGATFFITSGWLGGDKRLDWAGVLKLQEAGFEIGNHTVSHPNLLRLSKEEIHRQIEAFDRDCAKQGIVKATAFSYPGGHFDRRVLASLKKLGYLTARRGRDPEGPLEDNGGNGRAYVPHEDHPFLIPSAMTRGIGAQEDERIELALKWATAGNISILTYHGVPDLNRHCSTPIERFRKDMKYLKDSGAKVISLRELSRYVDLSNRPADAFAPIVKRLGLGTKNPSCDLSDPLPNFSWELAETRWTQKQVAYRILVASSQSQLDGDRGDLWDSGKVGGSTRKEIRYEGKALASSKAYRWKVQVWNRRDPAEIAKNTPYQSEELITELHKSRPGPFSATGTFTTSPKK